MLHRYIHLMHSYIWTNYSARKQNKRFRLLPIKNFDQNWRWFVRLIFSCSNNQKIKIYTKSGTEEFLMNEINVSAKNLPIQNKYFNILVEEKCRYKIILKYKKKYLYNLIWIFYKTFLYSLDYNELRLIHKTKKYIQNVYGIYIVRIIHW